MLNVMEELCKQKGYNYLRMDGTVAVPNRAEMIHQFNSNPDVFIFFLTTKTGGLGINLKSANKVVIFDPDWNPMVDL
jgi:DNA excision repair protein ERCC-6